MKNTKYLHLFLLPIFLIFYRCSDIDEFQSYNIYQYNDLSATLDTNKIYSLFGMVDLHLDESRYDSAQIYLGKISEIIPLNNVSKLKYFLLTRQSEIYYYNNLNQLGLLESEKALSIAQAINDSILLADAYNFLGLFHYNIDSLENSLTNYFEGIKHIKIGKNSNEYIALSEPHHLYGNIAEVYFKLGRYTDAWDNYNLSLRKAKALNQLRAMAIANAGLGDVCYKKKQYDAAIKYYDESKTYALESKNYDIALICYSGNAKCELGNSNEQGVKNNLNAGYELIKSQPDINRKYVLNFLDAGIEINKIMGKVDELTLAFDNVMTNDVFNGSAMTRYIVNTLNSRVALENTLLKRLINHEKSKNFYKNYINFAYMIVSVSSVIILGLIFWIYIFRRHYKHKIQLAEIKQSISKDLHDELGLGLTSSNYLLYNMLNFKTNPEMENEVKRVIGLNTAMVSQMHDIIWSMDESKDNIFEFCTDLKVIFKEFQCVHQLDGTFGYIADSLEIKINGFVRRNLLMCFKECLNNAIKHGEPTMIDVHMSWTRLKLKLHIKDNGFGYIEMLTSNPMEGNGIKNIQKRVNDCDGKVSFYNDGGANVLIEIPLAQFA